MEGGGLKVGAGRWGMEGGIWKVEGGGWKVVDKKASIIMAQ